MDEIGNWLYIVFIAIAVISSIFNAMKKKNQQPQTPVPAPKPPKQEYQSPPVPMKKTGKVPPPIPEHIRHFPFDALLASAAATTNPDTGPILIEEIEHVLAEELDLSDADAFRKAIIYSEIIHRKY
jgi:hypothetical protein